ncbi:MAG TPA: hemerythrin domain-containing protein [Candidatus Binataceae bacterium]|nr:hemerythrin domain-containing protein [Candidatus Binataceae bacterium]
MDGVQITADLSPCGGPLPDLEIPMINTMLTCLGSEHRRLDEDVLPLALAATRLARDHDTLAADRAAFDAWDEIRSYLYSHLQIEDSLVLSWGDGHQAISSPLLETLKLERQEMHNLLARLPLSSNELREPQTNAERRAVAETLLALARTLDLHVARYDAEVLPSIRRALFHR